MIFSNIQYKGLDDPELRKLYLIEILQKGDDGPVPFKGQWIYLQYSGYFANTGDQFDENKSRNRPLEIRAGEGKVIKCWDDVVMHMTINTKIRIFCPSEKAYGPKGSGNLIPPNMDLYFEIKRVMEEENDEF